MEGSDLAVPLAARIARLFTMKDPIPWPPTATMRTPRLKDMTESMTKYARPIRREYTVDCLSAHTTWLEPGFAKGKAERNSTATASRNTSSSATRYILRLSPGHPEKSMIASWPQYRLICICNIILIQQSMAFHGQRQTPFFVACVCGGGGGETEREWWMGW